MNCNATAKFYGASFQRFLLRLIVFGHLGKTLVRYLALNIILVKPLNDGVEFVYPCLCLLQLSLGHVLGDEHPLRPLPHPPVSTVRAPAVEGQDLPLPRLLPFRVVLPPLPEHQCPVQYLGRRIGQQVAVWVLPQLVPGQTEGGLTALLLGSLPQHIGKCSDLLLCQFLLKGEQGVQVHLKQTGQRGQQGDIRIGVVPLPLVDSWR